MVVLIDTNILLDFLNKRTPHDVFANKVLLMLIREWLGFITLLHKL